MIEIVDVESNTVVGRTQFVIRDALCKARIANDKLKLLVIDEKKKFRGTLEINSFTARRFYTFFDQVFRSKLNIVPVIGVDFSLGNLTMNDDSFCLHTLKPGVQNEYLNAFKSIDKAFRPFSSFQMAYGYGAKTIPTSSKVCDLFSMTGDFQDPFVT